MSEQAAAEGDGRSRLSVVVADGSWHYARALEASLGAESGIDVIALTSSPKEAVHLVEAHAPDVIVLDAELSEMGGILICEQLRDDHSTTAVVLITASVDRETLRRGLAAGARACVVKRDHGDPQRIASAVRAAADGDHLLDAEVHQLLRELAERVPDPAREAGLTPRELDVLPLIAEGLLNKEIADLLGLSLQTVKNHASNISRKLDVTNRTRMILEARRRGIIL
ncbi:MAG: response regulator transcription factor [Gaiellaceae bacterium]